MIPLTKYQAIKIIGPSKPKVSDNLLVNKTKSKIGLEIFEYKFDNAKDHFSISLVNI
jgi:hypothetical protein